MNATPVSIAAFTGGRTISSRRFRVLQYIAPLAREGVRVHESVARFSAWPPRQRWLRPAWVAGSLAERLLPVLGSHRHDLTLLQRELLSTLLTLEPLSRKPRVLDVDDAVWLNGPRAERNFARLASICQGALCGNKYLVGAVSQWNPHVQLLPTAVDTDRFAPSTSLAASKRPIIGWSGLHAGSGYLIGIQRALAAALERRPEALLRIVSDRRPELPLIDPARIEFLPWSADNEVRTIQEMTIGLMPIDDTEWSKGKCSYKMLLYMACGVPVVVSPHGMNAEVLAQGHAGFGAGSGEEWVDRILYILDHPTDQAAMASEGRRVVLQHYSLHALVPTMAAFLRATVARGP